MKNQIANRHECLRSSRLGLRWPQEVHRKSSPSWVHSRRFEGRLVPVYPRDISRSARLVRFVLSKSEVPHRITLSALAMKIAGTLSSIPIPPRSDLVGIWPSGGMTHIAVTAATSSLSAKDSSNFASQHPGLRSRSCEEVSAVRHDETICPLDEAIFPCSRKQGETNAC